MKKTSTIFLQIVTVLIGIGALAFLLLEPLFEGRNAHSTLFQVYFNDAFLAWAYLASIPFFIALYQAFKIFKYSRENNTQPVVRALRTIKYCGTILVVFVIAAEAYLFIVRPGDDIAGGVFIGLLMFVVFGVITIVTTRLEKSFKQKI